MKLPRAADMRKQPQSLCKRLFACCHERVHLGLNVGVDMLVEIGNEVGNLSKITTTITKAQRYEGRYAH
eukprot:9377090-Pyramimonas_sp.AAC.1